MRFENTVGIRRHAAEVFAFLADLENVPRWNHAIAETRKVSDGPVGVGTRYRQVRTIPNRSEEELEVTALEPGRRLGVSGTLGPFRASLDYVVRETGEATEVTNTVDLEASGPLKLVAPLAVSRVKSAVAQNLAKLKTILESGDA